MRKTIAIVLDDMSVGGIPKACADFVSQLIDYFDVTMIMRSVDGEMMSLLPANIQIITTRRLVFRDISREMIKKHKYILFTKFAIPYVYTSRISNRWVKANAMVARERGIHVKGEYDCVIAYHGMNIGHLATALYGVNAKRKIAWIHGDHPFEGIHKHDVEHIYQEFDRIFCVSPVVRERFLTDFPKLELKTESYKNHLDPDLISKKAKESVSDFTEDDRVKLVTVGRISKEKGQELIPPIVRELENRNIKVHWYLVGDGDDMERIRNAAKELMISDYLTFLGSKDNPYPYIKKCDIYVQPSYTEGYCLTVCEAAILCKPIVLTAAAAAGILENGKNAIVTEASAVGLTNGIEYLITHKSVQDSFESRLKKEDFSNRNEINKLLDYLR